MIDEKQAEADFSLEKPSESAFGFFEASAARARSWLLAGWSLLGFRARRASRQVRPRWDDAQRHTMKKDTLARFFRNLGAAAQHRGMSEVNAGSSRGGSRGVLEFRHYFFSRVIVQPVATLLMRV